MAVTKVEETLNDGGLDKDGFRRYRREFMAVTDTPLTSILEVTADSRLPLYGETYDAPNGEVDVGSVCIDISGKRRARDTCYWDLIYLYSSETTPVLAGSDPLANQTPGGTSQGSPSEQDPTLAPPEIRWSSAEIRRAFFKDLNGKALANSLGDPFVNFPDVERARMVLSVSSNERTFDYGLEIGLLNKLNKETFFGEAPGVVRYRAVTADAVFAKRLWYWRVSRVFAFDPDDYWVIKVLNAGMRQKNNSYTALERIRDPAGGFTSYPVPIKKDTGKALDTAELAAGLHEFMEFEFYAKKSFTWKKVKPR